MGADRRRKVAARAREELAGIYALLTAGFVLFFWFIMPPPPPDDGGSYLCLLPFWLCFCGIALWLCPGFLARYIDRMHRTGRRYDAVLVVKLPFCSIFSAGVVARETGRGTRHLPHWVFALPHQVKDLRRGSPLRVVEVPRNLGGLRRCVEIPEVVNEDEPH